MFSSILKNWNLFCKIILFVAFCGNTTTLSGQDKESSTPQFLEELNYLLLVHADSGNLYEVQILLDSGIDPNTTSFDGITALMYACQSGNYLLVRELIARRAGINARSKNGTTALHVAARANNDSIAELLILNGADINAQDSKGVSALHLAAAYGSPFLTFMLTQYDATINITDGYGNTPLMLAVYSGSLICAEVLLEQWADVDKTDNLGFTPLMVAAQFNDTLMLGLLTDYGAKVNLKNKKGLSALAIAIASKAEEAIDYLLEKYADIFEHESKVYYADLALIYGMPNVYKKILHKNKYFCNKPRVGSFSVSGGLLSNGNDLYNSIVTSLNFSTHGITLSIDYSSRPSAKAVLVETKDISYQFKEQRRLLSFSAEKSLSTKSYSKTFSMNYYLGARLSHSWGNYTYPDARTTPTSYWLVSPSIGVNLMYGSFIATAQTYILWMRDMKNIPIFFNLSAGYSFDFLKKRIKQKNVPWY